jgi:hypothetical protein
MSRESKGLELQSSVRKRLKKIAPRLNLEIYNRTKEYSYNYGKFTSQLKGRMPSCDTAIFGNGDLFLIEIDSKGTPTRNVAKVWFYVKNGGRFDEWKKPKKVYILHFLSENVTDYDLSIAEALRLETEKISKKEPTKKQEILFQYGNFEKFKLEQREMQDVAKELSDRIIDQVRRIG